MAETQRLETLQEADLRRLAQQGLKGLQKQLGKIEALIQEQLGAQEHLRAQAARLQEAPGVGLVTAAALLAYAPELGTLSKAQIAALAGLAPRNQRRAGTAAPRALHGQLERDRP